MPIRGVTDISGLRNIRSLRTSGRRPIQRGQSSSYLDLYMLQMAKERLVKEAALLIKRSQAIEKHLSEVQKQMDSLEWAHKLQSPSDQGDSSKEQNSHTKRKWKKVAVRY